MDTVKNSLGLGFRIHLTELPKHSPDFRLDSQTSEVLKQVPGLLRRRGTVLLEPHFSFFRQEIKLLSCLVIN